MLLLLIEANKQALLCESPEGTTIQKARTYSTLSSAASFDYFRTGNRFTDANNKVTSYDETGAYDDRTVSVSGRDLNLTQTL